jgi:photosystem II stability/assembly factor-like uncharacterized protein
VVAALLAGSLAAAVASAPQVSARVTLSKVTALVWQGGPRPMLVAVGDGVLAGSTDAGDTWTRIDPGAPLARVPVLQSDRSGGLLVSTTSGYAERSAADGRWTPVPDLPTRGTLWFTPGNRDRVFVGDTGDQVTGADDRFQVSTDRGRTWVDLAKPAGYAPASLFVVDRGGTRLFAAGDRLARTRRVWRSGDAGLTWQDSGPCEVAPLRTCELLQDPHDPRVLYSVAQSVGIGGGGNLLTRSLDAGATWLGIEGKPLSFGEWILPTTPSTLLVQFSDATDSTRYVLDASVDHGATWTRVGMGLPREGAITALAADPGTPEVVVAIVERGGVYRSRDAGRTWTRAGR